MMNRLRSIVRAVLPVRIRAFLRASHRDFVFRRAMKRFLKDPYACTQAGNPVLIDLIYGWGNEGWCAPPEYLAGCVGRALTSRGPVLECGSGLSTVLLGAIAKRQGQSHWVLEHKPEWATEVQSYLDRYNLESVVLCSRPLKDYGEFCWYDAPLESMPESFSLVVCDGPPGPTKGGRYGLAPIMGQRLNPGCIILLDDAGREGEIAVARCWEAELGASIGERGSITPYFEMTLIS
jgi:hypothetical protein